MNPDKLPVKPYEPNQKVKEATDRYLRKMEEDLKRMKEDPFFNWYDIQDIKAEMEKERGQE